MDEKKAMPKIWEGKKKVFLVCDESFKDSNAPFFAFLKEEGFSYGSHKVNYGCPWIHVDITTKQYAYGMPGVEPVGTIGDHAITISEFKTIYGIYKKYKDKSLFVFNKKRFDYKKMEIWPFRSENNPKTHETIRDAADEIDPDAKEVRMTIKVDDYDAPYPIHYTFSLYFPPFCDAQYKVRDFLNRIDTLRTITILEQKDNQI